MNFRNLLRNKGLVFAVSALVGLFLLFLLIISVIQTNSINYVRHVDTVNRFSENLDSGLYDGKMSLFKEDVQVFKNANTFKEPLPSQLNAVINAVDKTVLESAITPVIESAEIAVVEGAEIAVVEDTKTLIQKSSDVVRDHTAVIKALATVKKSLELERNKKTSLARYMQIAAAVLSLIFLLLIILPLISRIANNQDTVVESKKESEGIMGTVSEGLFLLTKDNEFGLEQSTSLREMFRSDRDLEGNFFDFIRNYVPQSTIQVAQDYLGLLYGDRVKEKLVKDLNPLNEVEINIVRRDGSFESRFLNFKFSRVMENNKLSHLLGSVTDVTREVNLQQELEESRDEQEAQLDLLMNILHIDNAQLSNFFEGADATLHGINDELESKGHSDTEIRKKLKDISASAHGLKGDAAALGLHKFEFSVHAFEDSISEVQSSNKSISGKQLLPAVTQLKVLFTELQNMRGLVSKFASNFSESDKQVSGEEQAVSAQAVSAPSFYSDLEKPLHNIVATVSERTNKRASLITHGLDKTINLPSDFSDAVVSISVQLIRNSIVHGALDPVERLAQNKTDYLNIVTSLTETDKGYTLIVRDDGEGLDEPAIIAKAVELGYIKQDEVDQLAPGAATHFIFKSGFSTKEGTDLDGGRGVGLNAVYNMIVNAGGKLSMRHKTGSYCQFQVFFEHQDKDDA